MTEQQSRIQSILLDLIRNAGKMIQVGFIPQHEQSRNSDENKSKAYRNGSIIRLVLYEPKDENYNDWAETISNAERLVGMLEQENIHDTNNPNFFKATIARVEQYNIYQ